MRALMDVVERTADRAVLRLTKSVMTASFDVQRPVDSTFGRAIGADRWEPTLLASALLKPLMARLKARFLACFWDETAEEFLEALLRLMQIVLIFDADYRRNVVGFHARYQFLSKDGGVIVAAIFDDGRLHICEHVIDSPHLTVTFASGRALLEYLFNPNQEILASIQRQEVQPDGNLNYLYRLGYLAKRLQALMLPAA